MSVNPQAPRILIVDDTVGNLVLLNEMLSGAGYVVAVANCGPDALESARLVVPDMVLLDILMPGMDGYTVLSRLKADPATSQIPVLLLSALDEPESKTKGFDLGACDYVTKPFHLVEILARMTVHLKVADLERRLRRSEAAMRQAETIAGLGTWTFDPEDGAIQWSDELYSLLGLPAADPRTVRELLGHIFLGEDLPVAVDIFADPLRHLACDRVVELRTRETSGARRTLRARGRVAPGIGAGGRDLFIGILQDVSEFRDQASEGLARQARLLRVLEDHPDGVLRIDARLTILHANRSASHWLGFPAETLVGSSLSRLDVTESDDNGLASSVARVVNSGGGRIRVAVASSQGSLPMELLVVPEDDGGSTLALFLRPCQEPGSPE